MDDPFGLRGRSVIRLCEGRMKLDRSVERNGLCDTFSHFGGVFREVILSERGHPKGYGFGPGPGDPCLSQGPQLPERVHFQAELPIRVKLPPPTHPQPPQRGRGGRGSGVTVAVNIEYFSTVAPLCSTAHAIARSIAKKTYRLVRLPQ
ncbi:hypothetical protein P879_03049 [Paragonimus westermani]|uniref:Uncharacterized protein n=1 Tax=Paragonimus westermani TaxID=34504 RepID=A0A8T0DTB6_9TREM|nr:hypothetical protein P879_03049 [Paragonimus westermani]